MSATFLAPLKRSADTFVVQGQRQGKRQKTTSQPSSPSGSKLVVAAWPNGSTSTWLCSQCSKIQLDQDVLAARAGFHLQSMRLYNFDDVHRKCSLCRMFFQMIVDYNILPSSISSDYSLWAKSAAGVEGFAFELRASHRQGNCGWLFPMESEGSPQQHRRRAFARDICTDKVNWVTVKQWISCCQSEHSDSCGSTTSMSLPGFVVIDCFARNIVSAPVGCKYAALSYVWGSETCPSLRSDLPTSAPLLIEDAMICTRAIGLQYLWVDRYCIDQANVTKDVLIHNMDHIYSRATVTIINAAGESSSSGLPGVSDVARRPYSSMAIRDQQLMRFPNTRAEIARSKWSKRAWTFQEGLLSRRRLVFTSSQIYFQCQETHYWEMIPLPFSSQPVDLDQWVSEGLDATLGPNTCVFPIIEPRSNASKVNALIREYLRREMSYESDVLNAIIGILRHVCSHFWGLPFEPWSLFATQITPLQNQAHPDSAFLAALLWTPEYESARTISKRSNFPSWSWVAYKGITGIKQGSHFWDACDTGIDVKIQDRSHYTLDVLEYMQEMDRKYDTYRYKPCVFLTGWVTYLRFRCVKTPWDGMLTAGHPMSLVAFDKSLEIIVGSVTIMTSLFKHTASDMKTLFEQEWPVLLYVNESVTENLCGLVLKPMRNGRYQRLGTLFSHRFPGRRWSMEGNMACLSRAPANDSTDHISSDVAPPQIGTTLECEWDTIELR